MARVLGLSFFFHNSAAALVCDGEIVAAAEEERFARQKNTNQLPKLAIEYCLEAADLGSINDLDAIVFYEKPIRKLLRNLDGVIETWPLSLINFSTHLPRFLKKKLNVYRVLRESLPEYRGRIFFSEHHLSHAASAFYCSPFKRAAILTLDGVGEYETTTLGWGDDLDIHLKKSILFPHSIGLLYSALTSYLGFEVNDGEWKVMGLAPYGTPRYAKQFEELVNCNEDGSFQLNLRYFAHHYSSRWSANHRRWEELFGFPRREPEAPIDSHHQDLACSGQKMVERMILSLASEAQRVGNGCENLVIAGGVGLNGVANGLIDRSRLFKNVWVQPAAGDEGGALGAALLVSQQFFRDKRCRELEHVYLGPAYDEEEIESLLREQSIPYVRLSNEALVQQTADFIQAGKVVGWFQGRMEFGPRALGARSILASATLPEMKAVINEKVKFREFFRPFAPAVLLEDVHEYFEVAPGTALPFMVKVLPVRTDKRHLIPAVTHQDGSARIQTVTEKTNPLFHRLLKELKVRSGIPVILNTSFNVRGEPIVCSPQEAYDCFLNSGLNALVLGNFFIAEKRQAPLPPQIIPTVCLANDRGTVSGRVLEFYRKLPFNAFGSAIDAANDLRKSNRVKQYPCVDKYLKRHRGATLLDVGCGAGWFVNSCASFYDEVLATGIDFNPGALRQARNVNRLIPYGKKARFVQSNLFEFEPQARFDIVNSLGVLHHTPDCHAAIRHVLGWVKPGGYLHLGLYHQYGRQPALELFSRLKAEGTTLEELLEKFRRLNPDFSDETQLLSWFRDQVLHPYETQHTYDEIFHLLAEEGWQVEATSINQFQPIRSLGHIVAMEKKYAEIANRSFQKKRYFPGFFTVWAHQQ